MRQRIVPCMPFGLLLGGMLLVQPAYAEERLKTVAHFNAPSAKLMFVDDDDDDDRSYRRRWRKPYIDGQWRGYQERRGYSVRGWNDDDDRRYRRRWRRDDDDDDDDD